jgi:hypothetical protein
MADFGHATGPVVVECPDEFHFGSAPAGDCRERPNPGHTGRHL